MDKLTIKMSDLKEFGKERIKELQVQIDTLNEELKQKNQKIFDKIANLEAQKTPIEKLIKDYDRQQKTDTKKPGK